MSGSQESSRHSKTRVTNSKKKSDGFKRNREKKSPNARTVKIGVSQLCKHIPLIFINFVIDLDPKQKNTKSNVYANDIPILIVFQKNFLK